MCLSVFPMNDSVSPTAAFPTRGLCRVGISPLSIGTMKRLRPPAPYPDRLSHAPDGAFPKTAFFLLAVAGSRHHCARTLLSRFVPASGAFLGKTAWDLPCSLIVLLCLCPVLRPRPARRLSVHLPRRRCCPPYYEWEDAGQSSLFGALSHGFGTRCVRFVPASRRTTQHSLPAGRPAFAGRESNPLDCSRMFQFSRCSTSSFLLPILRVYQGATRDVTTA